MGAISITFLSYETFFHMIFMLYFYLSYDVFLHDFYAVLKALYMKKVDGRFIHYLLQRKMRVRTPRRFNEGLIVILRA